MRRLFTLALIPATAAASALHGGNWTSKGYLMAAHVLLCCVIQGLLGPWWAAPAGIPVSGIFWFIFRSGKIAQAELTAIRAPNEDNFNAVWKAYLLPNALATVLAGGLLMYAKAYWWFIAIMPLWLMLYVPLWAVKRYNHVKRPDLKQREIDAQAEKGSTDRIIDGRRMTEIVSGLFPCGYAAALLIIAIHLALGAFLHVATI